MHEKKGELVICGFVKQCKIKKCVHKEPHQYSDACKGMCKHMGYAECREIRK
jgi:hypothetical protein